MDWLYISTTVSASDYKIRLQGKNRRYMVSLMLIGLTHEHGGIFPAPLDYALSRGDYTITNGGGGGGKTLIAALNKN